MKITFKYLYAKLLLIIMVVLLTECRTSYSSPTDLDFMNRSIYISEKNKNGVSIPILQQRDKQWQTYTSDGVSVKGFDIETNIDTIAHRHFTAADIKQIKKILGRWYSKKNNYQISEEWEYDDYDENKYKVKYEPRRVFELDAFEGNWLRKGIYFVLLKFDDGIIINTFTPEEFATPEYQQIRSNIINRLQEYYTEEVVDEIMEDFDRGPYEWRRTIGRYMD